MGTSGIASRQLPAGLRLPGGGVFLSRNNQISNCDVTSYVSPAAPVKQTRMRLQAPGSVGDTGPCLALDDRPGFVLM